MCVFPKGLAFKKKKKIGPAFFFFVEKIPTDIKLEGGRG